MAIEYLYPGSILSMTKKAAELLLRNGNGDAALLYLSFLAEKNPQELHWSPDRLEEARHRLVELRLIDPATPAVELPPEKLLPETAPDYTTEDVASALKNGSGFAELVPEVERLLGKVLSPNDLKILYSLYDFLELPPEVILMLTGWCVEQAEKNNGTGRRPSLSRIRTEGKKWYENGINSLDAAEAYIHRLTETEAGISRIMRLLDFRGRTPVAEEKRFLAEWAVMGFADDAIRMAYEITVMNTGKLTWRYMNSILKKWQSKGLYTAAAINDAERPRPRRQTPPDNAPAFIDEISRMLAQSGGNPEG